MSMLRALFKDTYFKDRCTAYANGQFLNEEHVAHCAFGLAQDMTNAYGLTSVLSTGYVLQFTLMDEQECILVSRFPYLGAVPEGLEEVFVHHTSYGHIVMFRGLTDEIKRALAKHREGDVDKQQAQDSPLLH